MAGLRLRARAPWFIAVAAGAGGVLAGAALVVAQSPGGSGATSTLAHRPFQPAIVSEVKQGPFATPTPQRTPVPAITVVAEPSPTPVGTPDLPLEETPSPTAAASPTATGEASPTPSVSATGTATSTATATGTPGPGRTPTPDATPSPPTPASTETPTAAPTETPDASGSPTPTPFPDETPGPVYDPLEAGALAKLLATLDAKDWVRVGQPGNPLSIAIPPSYAALFTTRNFTHGDGNQFSLRVSAPLAPEGDPPHGALWLTVEVYPSSSGPVKIIAPGGGGIESLGIGTGAGTVVVRSLIRGDGGAAGIYVSYQGRLRDGRYVIISGAAMPPYDGPHVQAFLGMLASLEVR